MGDNGIIPESRDLISLISLLTKKKVTAIIKSYRCLENAARGKILAPGAVSHQAADKR